MLQYTAPAYVLVLAPLLLGEPFRRIDAYAVGLAMGGMVLFFVDRLAPGSLGGNLAGVVCGVFSAANALRMRYEARPGGAGALPSITLGNAIAALVALPFAWHDPGAALTAPGLLTLAYLGVVQMGLAYICFIRGLRSTPAIDASLLSMLEAALNPLWALLVTGERPGAWAVLGGTLILGSTALRSVIVELQLRARPPAAVGTVSAEP